MTISAKNVVWGEDFFDSLGKLPKAVKLQALLVCGNLMQGKVNNGMNFESLNNPLDRSFRSIRLDNTYRLILSEQPKSYIMLWADHHDDAYDWARNRRLNVNRVSGALELQVIKTVEVVREIPVYQTVEVEGSLLSHITKEQLNELLPVSDDLLVRLLAYRDVDSMLEDSQMLEEALGRSGVDVLLSLASGDDYDTVKSTYLSSSKIDPDDIDTAVDNKASQMSFFKFDNENDMKIAAEYPLDKWRLFLHPDQRVLVEKDFNGPVRVTGGAGTGKTVAAMHRARHLAQRLVQLRHPGKVLFTTFTKNLALDIEDNLTKLCDPDELEHIEVINLDAWAHERMKQRGINVRLSFIPQVKKAAEDSWQDALDKLDGNKRPTGMSDAEIEKEWKHVIQANGVNTLAEYYRVSRAGRRISLRKADKEALWLVFEEYRALLKEQGIMEPEDMYAAVCGLIDEDPRISAMYEHVIVDEAQDFGNAAYKLIAKILSHKSTEVNGLYITGDAHQRIYSRKVVLSRCGINVRGRSRRLRINYRTTEETRKWATAVLDNCTVDDLDNGTESNKGYRSLTKGVPPQVHTFADAGDEMNAIAQAIKDLQAKGVELSAICIAAPSAKKVDEYRKELAKRGVETDPIESNKRARDSKLSRISTFHRVKGLEFDYMILVSMDDQTWEPYMVDEDAKLRARCLVHVAATRARVELLVTATPALAGFLGNLTNTESA